MRRPLPWGRRQHGLSLLEVLVALVIMALSLGALYDAVGGSVRAVIESERRVRAATFAQSLLEAHEVVEPGGMSVQGRVDDYQWTLDAVPFPTGWETTPGWRLYRVIAVVAWGDGEPRRAVTLSTLLPERQLVTDQGAR